jgi:hypothetical protein
VSEPLSGEWPTADTVAQQNEPVTDGEGLPDQRRHPRDSVLSTLAAVEERLGAAGQLYCRSRDLADEAGLAPQTVGAILALLADYPDTVRETYDVETDIIVSRWGQQPAGTVWEVSRDA